jgi:mono/diheme cytochrome c family protein
MPSGIPQFAETHSGFSRCGNVSFKLVHCPQLIFFEPLVIKVNHICIELIFFPSDHSEDLEMRNFILGVVITIAILLIGGLGIALLGFMPTNANTTPPKFETQIAMSALDAAMERHAPRVNNPVPPTDDNLISGLKIYTMNCALCHGGIDRQPSTLEKSFYPPPPNLILHPLDDPEWHVFYAIRTGVRYTAMPAWDKTLSESDIWKLTGFLTRIDKLPPAVQDYWKRSTGVSPPTSEPEPHSDHKM